MATRPPPRPGPLAGLSEERALELLLAAVRQAALEDGVAARIVRKGYGRFTVEVTVREWAVTGYDVGSRATHREDSQ